MSDLLVATNYIYHNISNVDRLDFLTIRQYYLLFYVEVIFNTNISIKY